jgi:hypothetical protein
MKNLHSILFKGGNHADSLTIGKFLPTRIWGAIHKIENGIVARIHKGRIVIGARILSFTA